MNVDDARALALRPARPIREVLCELVRIGVRARERGNAARHERAEAGRLEGRALLSAIEKAL